MTNKRINVLFTKIYFFVYYLIQKVILLHNFILNLNKSKYLKKFFHMVSLVVFFSLISIIFSSPAFGERFDIRDNETGGDCTEIGFWNMTSKTCIMDRDLSIGDQIRISSNGVTLNGMGHHINGDGIISGVYIPDRQNVKVSNLVISNAENGLFLNNSSNNTIEDITSVWNTEHAIYMIHNSDHNTIKNNSFGFSIEHGISIAESDYNKFENNIIINTKDGIRLKISNYTTISGNHFWDNRVEALDIHGSSMNSIYNNNFFEKEAIPIIDDCDECTSQFFGKDGGNYYLNYDENDEGCFDSDSNGFCDYPYSFEGGVDKFPLIQNSTGKLNHSYKTDLLLKSESLSPFKNELSEKSSNEIPDWVTNLVMWFYFEEISENNFTNAMEFLIQKDIIPLPTITNTKLSENPISQELKIKLAWWGSGLANDDDFKDLIIQLVEEGFIQV